MLETAAADKESLRTILAQAEKLEEYLLDSDSIEPHSVRKQYHALREKPVQMDFSADGQLPFISERQVSWKAQSDTSDEEELLMGVGQMVAYLKTKVEVPPERVSRRLWVPLLFSCRHLSLAA